MASQRPGKEAEQAELGLVFGGKLYPKDSNGVSCWVSRGVRGGVGELTVGFISWSLASSIRVSACSSSLSPVPSILTPPLFSLPRLPIPAAHANTFHQKGLTLESPSSNPLSSSPSSTPASAEQAEKDWLRELKLVFEKSADPWGRIVVYGVELLSDHRGEF
jgi:hypothetical protein